MNESIQHEPRDVTSLSRKSWITYIWPVVLTLLALALTLPPAGQHGWTTALTCGAVILAISAYIIWTCAPSTCTAMTSASGCTQACCHGTRVSLASNGETWTKRFISRARELDVSRMDRNRLLGVVEPAGP